MLQKINKAESQTYFIYQLINMSSKPVISKIGYIFRNGFDSTTEALI